MGNELSFLYFDKGLTFSFFKKRKVVFIIHGHDDFNRDQLKLMLHDLDLKPIVLGQFHTFSSYTIIEKLEKIGTKCKFAFALCTPDDSIHKENDKFYQPRPNVLYEMGWFCGKLGRSKVMFIVKDGTNIFSDFQGVVQTRFKNQVQECHVDIIMALKNQGLV